MKRVVLFSLGLWCVASAAAEAQTRVVVHEFEGPSASQIRSVVVDILEEHAVEVVSTKVANAQARRSGAELDSESGRVRVAKKLRLNAFVEGRVEKSRRAFKVRITVYGARDGMVAGEMNLSAPKRQLASEVNATMWEQLGPAIRGEAAPLAEPEPAFVEAPVQPQRPQRAQRQVRPTRPVPVPEPDPEEEQEVAEGPPEEEVPEEPESEETEEPSSGTALAAASPLDINIGARFGGRNYKYNDPFPGLRKYGMDVSPNLRLHVRWFPAAHFDDGVLSNFGLDVRGELLVGVTSKNRAGQKFETSAHSFGVGLRGRLPLRALELGAIIGYGMHAFSLEGTSKANPDVPNAGYGFLRTGLDARVNFWVMYTQLSAAYLFGLSHGEIAEEAWFPHTSGDGVELDLALGVFFSKVLGVEAAFGLQRYFMSFDPEPRDPGVRGPGRVAGGAVDQYISGRVAMVIRL
jgi:hypothetical protein